MEPKTLTNSSMQLESQAPALHAGRHGMVLVLEKDEGEAVCSLQGALRCKRACDVKRDTEANFDLLSTAT